MTTRTGVADWRVAARQRIATSNQPPDKDCVDRGYRLVDENPELRAATDDGGFEHYILIGEGWNYSRRERKYSKDGKTLTRSEAMEFRRSQLPKPRVAEEAESEFPPELEEPELDEDELDEDERWKRSGLEPEPVPRIEEPDREPKPKPVASPAPKVAAPAPSSPARKAVITVARREARVGERCNPFRDQGNYWPLPRWIRRDRRLSSRDKILYACLLYRVKMCARPFQLAALANATGMTQRKVVERIKKFRELHLVKLDKFGAPYLADRNGESRRAGGVVAAKRRDEDDQTCRIPVELAKGVVSDSAVIVYAALAGIAGREGWAFTTNETLAEECGCLKAALKRSIRELEEAKLIEVEQQAVRGSRVRDRVGAVKHNVFFWQKAYHFLGHAVFCEKKVRRKSV